MADLKMNDSTNYSAYYLNQEVCDKEKQATNIYIGILGGMLSISFYFLVSLSVALCRRRGPTDPNCTLQYATVLRALLVAVILTLNVRLVIDILQLGLGEAGYNAFGIIFVTKSALATLSTACVYAFLWLRQWVLYDQPILKKVKTKTVFKTFNILVLVLTVSLVAMGPVLEARYVLLKLTHDGCMLANVSRLGIAFGIYTGFSLSYQLILLGFFIYPVKVTHAHASHDTKSRVAPIVKRCTLAAAACVLNEIIFIAVHNLIERPVMLNTITMDLKLIVYYICMVSSYNDWKSKFLFCLSKQLRRTGSLSSRHGTDFRSKLSSAGDVEGKNLRGEV